MLEGDKLKQVIKQEQPDFIVPEIEAIATTALVELEAQGFNIIPTARAVNLTMNREGIRRLAAEKLGLKTSLFKFAETKEEYLQSIKEIGIPCVVKPIMSSSGKGQSTILKESDIEKTWQYAQQGGRTGEGKVIVEGFVDFDYEITLLTIRHQQGTSFCAPIGHQQVDGDYRQSWQPQQMSELAKEKAIAMAQTITDNLGGWGIFGVELFIKGDDVIFSEVSPRPHDTGLVTLISQNLSQFALHARAILGLPIPNITQYGSAASSVILAEGDSSHLEFENLEKALVEPDTQIRLFGKPKVKSQRRMGVVLALGETIEQAKQKAIKGSQAVSLHF
jgi:phosphoribosylglycinamide formyltransferase 2